MIGRLRGIVPPLVTPLDEQGEVDVAALSRLTEHLIAGGAHGLFVLGSTGEVAYLDDGQRRRAIEAVAGVAAGKVPVLAGVIDLTSSRVVRQVAAAVAAGADGVVATAPLYAINDAGEVEDHFRRIAEASSVPVYAYDIPVRVHRKLDARSLLKLAAEGVLAGVKDSSGDDVGFRRLIAANRQAGSPLSILTGHEVIVDSMLRLGADGAVPGLANVDIAGYRRLWDATEQGDWSRAADEQARLAALFEITAQACGRSGDAAGVGSFKVAMELQGLLPSARMAAPVRALDGEAASQVGRLVRAAGLVE